MIDNVEYTSKLSALFDQIEENHQAYLLSGISRDEWERKNRLLNNWIDHYSAEAERPMFG